MKRWTPEEITELRWRIDRGMSVIQIAQVLGRSQNAVRWRVRYLGLSGAVSHGNGMYAAQAAAIMQVHVETITRWLRKRILHGRVIRIGTQRRYIIEYDALVQFVEKSEYWMLWVPEQITDPTLRHYAREVRTQAGWDWLAAQEFARKIQVKHKTLLAQIEHGHYPEARCVGYRWWIPSYILESVDTRITPAEAAVLLNLSIRTIWHWCQLGKFKTAEYVRRQWYIDRTEVLLHEAQKGVQ